LSGPDGRELTQILAQPKRAALLVYLAAQGGFRRRDEILALFWPDLDAAHARAALNQAISFLRKSSGGSGTGLIVNRGPEELGIDVGTVWCDAVAFREAVGAGRYAEALQLYRGDLLPGFFAGDAGGFDEWLDGERSHLRAQAATAARAVAEKLEREEHFTQAVAAARRAVELSDLDERRVRDLLCLLDRLGDRAGAIRTYETFAAKLAEEYGAEPAAATSALMARIRQRVEAAHDGVTIEKRPDPGAAATAAPFWPTVPGVRVADMRIDRWQLEREIGRGGMATVYLARDARHERHVAIKTLRPEGLLSIGADRFLREIQITAQLAHPHILPLIDSGTRDGTLYLVTPFVPGESLRARLDREGTLPVADAIRIASEIAEALDYAHRHGIIHRDIKPENILLADGHAVVADFGIARALKAARVTPIDDDADAELFCGTPAYTSPEARTRGEATPHADIYSLGCVLLEMLGVPPSADGPMAESLDARTDVPAHVRRLVADCVSPVSARRPVSAAEVERRLSYVGQSQSSSPATARLSRYLRPVLMTAGVILAAAVAWGMRPLIDGSGNDDGLPRQLTINGHVKAADLSPDGSLLAYASAADSGIFVRDLASGLTARIGTEPDVVNLRWSPDGSSILAVQWQDGRDYNCVVYSRLGGAPRSRQRPCLWAAWADSSHIVRRDTSTEAVIAAKDR